MLSTVQLRDDYDAAQMRVLAKHSRDPRQIRRFLALAAVYDGMSRAAAAKVGGNTLSCGPSPSVASTVTVDPNRSLNAMSCAFGGTKNQD